MLIDVLKFKELEETIKSPSSYIPSLYMLCSCLYLFKESLTDGSKLIDRFSFFTIARLIPASNPNF